MLKKSLYPALLVPALLVAAPVWASSDWNCYSKKGSEFSPCFYAGAGLGLSSFDPDEKDTGYETVDDNDSGWLLYGGYHIDPDWFVELAWADLGEAAVKAANQALPSGNIAYTVPNIMAGYYIDPYRLSEGEWAEWPIDIFIKAGIAAIDNSASPSSLPWEQENDVQLALGGGIEWRFDRHWKVRGAVESYDVDALFYSVSVAYVFGDGPVRKPAAPAAAPAAKPVAAPAPAEPPAPARQPEPLPSPIIEIEAPKPAQCSAFDGSVEGVVFKVNSDELTEPSKAVLLKSAEVLKKFPQARFEIQAHTDSDGSAEYNRQLSARRAEAVKAFFISQGVDAARLTATGYGEDRPVADNATAEGKAKNRRVELKADKLEACD